MNEIPLGPPFRKGGGVTREIDLNHELHSSFRKGGQGGFDSQGYGSLINEILLNPLPEGTPSERHEELPLRTQPTISGARVLDRALGNDCNVGY